MNTTESRHVSTAGRQRTWEHAIESVLCLGALAMAAASLLPRLGVPGWMPPLIWGLGGIVIGLAVWAGTGRPFLSGFCTAYGIGLSLWTTWAEISRVWDYGVIAAWLIMMIIACPAAGHALREAGPMPAPELPPGGQPEAIGQPPDPAEVERLEQMAKFEHMFSEIGCDGITVTDLREERAGRVVSLKLPRSGQVVMATLDGVTSKIEVILRLRPGSVEFMTGADASEVTMKLRERDVFAEVARLRPEMHATTINEPFAIGIQEDGTLLHVLIRELHMFLCGTTGAGKSNLINVILAQLNYCPDTLIWVIDMKGGRTARPWLQAWVEGKANAPGIDWVATTREEAALMIRAFETAIDTRANSGIGGPKITPSSGMPQVILICDEMADLFGASSGTRRELGDSATTNQQFIATAERAVRKGRSEAVTSIWATQRGTVDTAGSGTLKSLLKLRLALGASSENELRYVIPDARMSVKSLGRMAATPGLGVLAVVNNASQLTKFFFHDHIEGACSEGGNDGCVAACPVYQTSIEIGSIRPRLDPMTAGALGEAYSARWQRAEHLLRRPVPAGATAVMEPVDTSEFEGIIGRSYPEDPDKKIHPVRLRTRELLSARGPQGATPKWLRERLAEEGFEEGRDYARETHQRWLAEDQKEGILHQANDGFNRWVYGPGR